jgi:hypothetical protein
MNIQNIQFKDKNYKNIGKFMTFKPIFITIVLLLISQNAIAQQWAAPGDATLRRDVELLKSYNIIDGPLNTWPISWKQITKSINVTEYERYPSHVMSAIDRVRDKIPRKGFRGSATLRYTNEPNLVRGFSNMARSDTDLSASVGFTEESIEANVTVNYRDNVINNNVNFDSSYIAAHIGNWSLYAGAIDRWWGPGQDNTLLLGTNARPMMSAGFRRNDPKAFKSKWLNWIGPWTWDMFVANMGDNREIPDALMAGIRLGIEPIKNLEIGLSRTMQLCGQGRPCNFNTWTKSIIAIGDLDNTGSVNEPGNQLASIDLSYSFNIDDKSFKIYAEGTAEDEHIIVPFQFARLIGVTYTNPVGEKGDKISLNIELSDSGNVAAWLFGRRRAGIIYNHFIYKSGHRFDGRTLGHSFDNDSKLASITAAYTRHNGDTYRFSLRNANINFDDTPRNIVSFNRQKYQSAEFSASKALNFGFIEINVTFQTKARTLTQDILPRLAGGLTWRIDV